MEDNKNNLDAKNGNSSQNNEAKSITNTGNDSVSEQERIKKLQNEVQLSKEIFGASGSEDINKNLGVFTAKEPSVDLVSAPNTNLDKQDKINFKKFENTSRHKIKTGYSKNKFLEWFTVLLRSKKGFWAIVSSELFLLVIIITVSIILLITTKSVIFGFNGDGPLNSENLRHLGFIGYVFSIIAICPLAIPFIYLITSWFIGINQVISSRNFHLVVLLIMIICFLSLIISIVCCSIPLVDNANFVS